MGLDFTSMCYLGQGRETPGVARLPVSFGVPAALREPHGSQRLARLLAERVGGGGCLLGSSSLHLFHDLVGQLCASKHPCVFLVDEGLYPVARWCLERARARGLRVLSFRHYDPAAARAVLTGCGSERVHLFCDGYCPRSGRTAPLRAFAALTRARGGLLVVDDTQAFGLLGRDPRPGCPYGEGGGGSLPLSKLEGDDWVVIASLAKAYATPLAFLAGSKRLVEALCRLDGCRSHCSPPAIPLIDAAYRRMRWLDHRGEALKRRLWGRVCLLRRMLWPLSLQPQSGFPVQYLALPWGSRQDSLQKGLAAVGIRTVVVPRPGGGAQLLLVLRADHRIADVHYLAQQIKVLVGTSFNPRDSPAAFAGRDH